MNWSSGMTGRRFGSGGGSASAGGARKSAGRISKHRRRRLTVKLEYGRMRRPSAAARSERGQDSHGHDERERQHELETHDVPQPPGSLADGRARDGAEAQQQREDRRLREDRAAVAR